ncbi:MAG: glutamate racemase [Stenotrophobium sp.]
MSTAPIGVFDSGVGGISVLREIRQLLPHEQLIYYADSDHCPYGEKSREDIIARACHITETLLARDAKLIVVACNTATIAAVEHLRATYPVPFIGMEPAVKPAVAQTRSGVVGILATGASLGGEKFHRLLAQHAQGVRVITQPCLGWVERVEAGDLSSAATVALVRQYCEPLLSEKADTLVLGCTHYPFLRPVVAAVAGPQVALLDTGAAVARQTQRVLLRERLQSTSSEGEIQWLTSGDPEKFAKLHQMLMMV